MSIIDSILGQGALDQRLTDWDVARQFVIFDTIVNNPRLSDEVKVELQQIEQNAYDANNGQLTLSETQEIGRYYNYLKNNFPSATDDARFLAIFETADTVQAGESTVGLDDIEIPSSVRWGGILIALGAIGYLVTRD